LTRSEEGEEGVFDNLEVENLSEEKRVEKER
jgi:hypothetical protein